MRALNLAAGAVIAGLGLAACAAGVAAQPSPAQPSPAQPSPARQSPAPGRHGPPRSQCFFHNDVQNFAAADEQSVYIRVGARDVYRLEVFAPCPDIDWSLRVGLRNFGGSSWLCVGDQVDVFVPIRGFGPNRCPARIGRKLTPEEVAALPKRARP